MRNLIVALLTMLAVGHLACISRAAREEEGATRTATSRPSTKEEKELLSLMAPQMRGRAFALADTAGGVRYDLPGRYNPNFNTESYDHIVENAFLGSGLEPAFDLLDRRRPGLVQQRSPVHQRRAAAADRRGTNRGDDQLLLLRLPGPRRAIIPSRSRPRCPTPRGTPSTSSFASVSRAKESRRRIYRLATWSF